MASTDLIVDVTDETFDALITGDPRPVIVDATAAWCGPCQHMAADLHAFAEKHQSVLRVITLDVDRCIDAKNRLNVQAMPTLILLGAAGEEMRICGGQTLAGLEAALLPVAASAPVGAPAAPARVAVTSAKTVTIPDDARLRFIARGAATATPLTAGEQTVQPGFELMVQVLDPTETDVGFPLDVLLALDSELDMDLAVMGTEWTEADVASLGMLKNVSKLVLFTEATSSESVRGIAGMARLRSVQIRHEADDFVVAELRALRPDVVVNYDWISESAKSRGFELPLGDGESEMGPPVVGYLKLRETGNTLSLRIPKDSYAFGPDASDGKPLVITSLRTGEIVVAQGISDHLEEIVDIDLSGTPADVLDEGVELAIQICSGDVCAMPQTLWCMPTHLDLPRRR